MSVFGLPVKASPCETLADRCCWIPEDDVQQSREFLKSSTFVEILLSLVCLGLMFMLHTMPGGKMAILNLFFLPVALAGFALGRYRAGALALFVRSARRSWRRSNLADFTLPTSIPVAVSSLAIWASRARAVGDSHRLDRRRSQAGVGRTARGLRRRGRGSLAVSARRQSAAESAIHAHGRVGPASGRPHAAFAPARSTISASLRCCTTSATSRLPPRSCAARSTRWKAKRRPRSQARFADST